MIQMLHEKPAPTRVDIFPYLVLYPMFSGGCRRAVCRFGQTSEMTDGRYLSGELYLAPPSFQHGQAVKYVYETFKSFVNVMHFHAENLAARGIMTVLARDAGCDLYAGGVMKMSQNKKVAEGLACMRKQNVFDKNQIIHQNSVKLRGKAGLLSRAI